MNILWEHQQTGLKSQKIMLLVPDWYIGTERTPPLLQVTVKISKLCSPFLWGRRVQRLCTGLQTFQQSLLRGNFWLHVLVHHTKKKIGYLPLKTQSPTFSHNRILKKEPRVLKQISKMPSDFTCSIWSWLCSFTLSVVRYGESELHRDSHLFNQDCKSERSLSYLKTKESKHCVLHYSFNLCNKDLFQHTLCNRYIQTHAFATKSTGFPVLIVFQWLAGYVICELAEGQQQLSPAVRHQTASSSPDSETSVWAPAAVDAALHPENERNAVGVTKMLL